MDKRRSTLSTGAGVDETGCEVAGRVKEGRFVVTGERVVALEPGDFLLPGLMRYDSPSAVPSAKPAAAMPTVPIAHS